MTKEYLANLAKTFHKGDAREETYYKHLAEFLAEFSDVTRNKQIDITILPVKTEAGNPDFRIWDGRQKIIGYIEAKDLDTDLDRSEGTEQLVRYLATFPNVILTNFTEFRLYRNSELVDKTAIARPFIIKKLSTVPPVENEEKFFKLLNRFLDFSLPVTFTARTLAVELAKRTKFLKDEIISQELKSGTKSIQGFYEAFKEFLIAGINEAEFADLYSQTITYGLFAARLRAGEEFNRKLAYSCIPKSIGILRDIFKFISLEDLPLPMEIIIDDIVEVLVVADARKILNQYYHNGKGSDPVLHFYETFLSVYDPQTREKRGVYYTPEPVVSFIVRSIHQILKDKFNLPDGLAAKSVTLLDPAGGTLGFLAQAIETAVAEFKDKYGKGAVKDFIKDHILQNYYAFELMMAPYAIGHMKMSFLLEELGYRMEDDERTKYYLTNALDMKELVESKFPGMSSLSQESHEAGKIKKQTPILVVLGNPPYSYDSPNKGDWILEEIKKYYQIDGKPLGEKNPKGLQDDYVKFIRFAQWKIDQAGEGVLGFITNHSYLDNPTFRGMRQSLMNSFDEIYFLDLHGNSLKKERCPDGSKDENVFDIRQGVAIALFIKFREGHHDCGVFHSEIWGQREKKYDWLARHTISNTRWKKLSPKSEFYFFVPRDERLFKFYVKSPKVNEIFPVNRAGIVTARDNLTVKWTPEEVWTTILNFSKMDREIARQTYELGKDSKDWKIDLAQRDLIESILDRNKITPILYRPFDIRYTYYTGNSGGFHCRPRPEVMQHMLRTNLALCVGRAGQVVGLESNWNIVFCSEYIEDYNLFYRGGNVNFPLYLYSETGKSSNQNRNNNTTMMMIFDVQEPYRIKKPNINQSIYEKLAATYNTQLTPEQIFYYIYAILYSNIYRTKYAEFLKIDFPRIPFTYDYQLFITLGKLGQQLADLHLLKSKELEKTISKFSEDGTNIVAKPKFEHEKVWINNEQYFEGVTEAVWKYQVGGYQICEKWLKDRRGRTLSLEEIKTYCRIVTALSRTNELQDEIDRYYNRVEENILE